ASASLAFSDTYCGEMFLRSVLDSSQPTSAAPPTSMTSAAETAGKNLIHLGGWVIIRRSYRSIVHGGRARGQTMTTLRSPRATSARTLAACAIGARIFVLSMLRIRV